MDIIKARITARPKSMFDPMPEVFVTTADGGEHFLYDYYPDEINFTEMEFLGISLERAKGLKFEKDKRYLQS